MAQPLFCDNIGNNTNDATCCVVDKQNSTICQENFNRAILPFSGGCPTGDCLKDCSNTTLIYQSLLQDDPSGPGNGQGPIRRYQTCANVPNVASYLSQGVLSENITTYIGKNVSANATPDQLQGVTKAVTECLTATCSNARNPTDCQGKCAPVKLLVNGTIPNKRKEKRNKRKAQQLEGRPDDPSKQDERDNRDLKYSDSKLPRNEKEPPSHQELFEKCIVDFHKTQCYFSATIQVAALTYGIFGDTNFLITFMLLPLATNGVLPVVFTYYLMVYRTGKATLDTTLLTTICWLLSSVVYWVLYSSIIHINNNITSDEKRYRAYQQFIYKLSALDECGGYSALAVCPVNDRTGLFEDELVKASNRLRALTPIIWSFATLCLLYTLAVKTAAWLTHRDEAKDAENGDAPSDRAKEDDGAVMGRAGRIVDHILHGKSKTLIIPYYVSTLCFLAGIGMQLSLLSIVTENEDMQLYEVRWPPPPYEAAKLSRQPRKMAMLLDLLRNPW
ncbi:uncharacterized protein N0V89_000174 [Didymosphaeria variabile]|uniref:Uncharacterized protein n=1 Tax=Didymosphaeria variabile TaxID=1932322 RepID=A0A9W8XTR9_9PLEO|nr:uncharacterized protein N0V89_000174 [Didymosphaeria variabile]KAJ4359619.1 hypothetical protein N0V89_000174 [Didymosphaeria variabile]